jgi:diguanylate cyclase (GGDEF)-like protein
MPDHRDQPGPDEARRLAALHALALLDTEPEREFDALVALAADLLACPTAMLTLVDSDRQWVKARSGAGFEQTPRAHAFCNTTIQGRGAFVVEDAAADPTFADNPLVQEGLRFYAGFPIHAAGSDGGRHAIGAICVTDQRARALDATGARALVHLASLAEALIAARGIAREALAIADRCERQSAELAQRDAVFRQAERLAGIGSWRYCLESGRLDWSEGIYRLHALPVGSQLTLDSAMDHYAPDARARISAGLTRTIETGELFDMEEDFRTAEAQPRRMRAIAELERDGDRPAAVLGVFQDVTDRHRLEMALRHLAETDPLTGLANRAAFDRTLTRAIDRAHSTGTPLLLAMIDLDGFKAINDTLGHQAGDEVLRQIAHALRAPWLAGCLAARLGGDEFALVIDDLALAANPRGWRDDLEELLRTSVSAGGLTMACAASFGIARLERGGGARDLIHRADTLLYAAKRARVGERRRANLAG